MKKIQFFGLALALFTMVFSSCSPREESKSKKNTLRISLDTNPPSLDPRLGGIRKAQVVIGMLYEGLMRYDRDGNVIPGVADHFVLSDDKKSATFKLRESHWSNGERVIASDFTEGWRECLDPQFHCEHAYAFYYIKNAKAAKEGKISLDKVGLYAIDDETIKVEFEYPSPFFIELTANPIYSPIYRGDQKGERISNGPFKLKEWKAQEKILVEKNPFFREKDKVHLDGISIAILPDANTSLLMWERGELDLVGGSMTSLPQEAIHAMRQHNTVETIPSGGICWLTFNTEKVPFNNAKIRKALGYAINRNEIVNNLLHGNEVPALSILPKCLLLQQSPYFQDYNLTEAKKLFAEGLKELGFSKQELPPIELNYCITSMGENMIAQAIQQQWREAFGIKIELLGTERSIYLTKGISGDYQIRTATWYSWMNDPNYNLEFLKTKDNRINVTKWENSNYKRLVDLAEREVDAKLRLDYYRKAEQLLLDEMPIAPIYYDTYKFTKRDGISGLIISKLGQLDFREVEKQTL
ncbi:MAG: oligopeptide ABC transporter substrate-binding protein OppA [Chlamydiales bacterium]